MKFSQQLSRKNLKGKPILSVVTKRTYDIHDNGQCRVAEEQLPLNDELVFVEGKPDLLDMDIDLIHYKPFTDVVVRGFARSQSEVRKFDVGVYVGNVNMK